MNKKILYLGRWMLSALIMTPFLKLFIFLGIGNVVALFACQAIGALIFWNIDKKIFKGDRDE